jgi:hypothetical protein
MSTQFSLSRALAGFGVTANNLRRCWSGRTDDGKTVVMVLWIEKFYVDRAGVRSYRWRGRWSGGYRQGHAEAMQNLIWARDHCDGYFNVVLVAGHDEPSHKRHFFPADFRMKITTLDPEAGTFVARAAT